MMRVVKNFVVGVTQIFAIAIISSLLLVPSATGITEIVQHCCTLGRNKISDGTSKCESATHASIVNDIPSNMPWSKFKVCLAAIDLCCAETLRNVHCENGKKDAKLGINCKFQQKSEDYKLCCESCEIGLLSASSSVKCQHGHNATFGSIWDNVYYSCCTHKLSSEIQRNMCEMFPGELCADICIPVGNNYKCACKNGFVLMADNKTCLNNTAYAYTRPDMNNCDTNNPCEHICSDVKGNIQCFCRDGYELSTDNHTCTIIRNCRPGYKFDPKKLSCVDINECQLHLHNCEASQRCDNTIGSFHCIRFSSCGTGYTLNSHNGECEDDNECLLGTDNCLYQGPDYQCRNIPGSFRCEKKQNLKSSSINCPPGLQKGRAGSCVDVEECRSKTKVCGSNETCLEIKGSYRCISVACPANYIKDPEHKDRCKRFAPYCLRNATECLRIPLTYSYNYITLVSNPKIPLMTGRLDLFHTVTTPSSSAEFSLDLKRVYATGAAASNAATIENFLLVRTSPNQATVSLIKSVSGPQDIELDVRVEFYFGGIFGGLVVNRLFVFIAAYEL